ncbi:MAG: PIN domain-containing protein [Longimicrobiales bacterium]|nr:PIN domain-containing protein [Longimicrobiales bacterium]
MGVLIDTSVLVAHERGRLELDRLAAKVVRERADEPFYISVITVSELLHGARRAGDRVRQARRTAFVEGVIEAFPALPIDLPTARTHADLAADLAAGGRPVGTHDLWIAASALVRGLSLATLNVREFRRVPGLRVEVWG